MNFHKMFMKGTSKEKNINLMGAELSRRCDSVSASGMKLEEFPSCASVLIFLGYTSSQRKYIFYAIQRNW